MTGVRKGCGAGAPRAEGGLGIVLVGGGTGTGAVWVREENIRAVKDAPAAAEPAAIKASVDFDILRGDEW